MKKIDDKFNAEMRKRFELAEQADSEMRSDALSDIRFAYIPGEQWDEKQRKARRNRPCYEFNRIRQSIRQVTGDQRKNRPQVKIRATEDGDVDTAETMQGLIRNIETVSNAERAYDTGFEFAVSGGFGAWRITTDYASESAFEQEVVVKEIRNPFTVLFDPAANEWDRRDGMFAFVTERISEDAFKAKYPKAEVVSFDGGDNDDLRDWYGDEIRIAEYWVKEPITKTLLLLSDGRTVDKEEFEPVADELATQGVTVVKERQVRTFKVMQYVVSGAEILEGPTEWAGKFIPIVPCWGDLVNVEGEECYSGMVRHSRDSQRLYNFNRTVSMETVAKAPKAPYILSPEMIKGHEPAWNASSADDAPYLLANPDPQWPGGKPMREQGPQVPAAMVTMLQLDAEDLKATTGIYDASLGARSNETSGIAIARRDAQGQTANFEYIDNLSRSIRFTGEILVDLIPKIYDTQRQIRILGEDGSEQFVMLNQEVIDEETGDIVRLNDLGRGRYDVTVTVGPSFATARMEMADTLLKISQSSPQIAPVVTDLIVRSLDMPGGEEAAKRLRQMMVKQGIIQPSQEDVEEMQKMPPQEPSPEQQFQMKAAQVELQSKELANQKTLKELQSPPDMGPQLEAARIQLEQQQMQLEAARVESDNRMKVQIEAMKAEQEKWEAQLKAESDRYKADLEAKTKLEIAQIEQANKAQISSDQNASKLFAELQRIAQDANTGLQRAQEAESKRNTQEASKGQKDALQVLIQGLQTVIENSSKPRTVVVQRDKNGDMVGGLVQ